MEPRFRRRPLRGFDEGGFGIDVFAFRVLAAVRGDIGLQMARQHRPDAITLDLDNALDTNANRERLLFFPHRAAPERSIRELRERNRHVSIGLTVKRSFGGSGLAICPTMRLTYGRSSCIL